MRVSCNHSETVRLAPGNSFTGHEGVTDFGANGLTLELALCLLPAGGWLQCTFLFLASSDSLGEHSLSKPDTVGEVIEQLASGEVSCAVSGSPTMILTLLVMLKSVQQCLNQCSSARRHGSSA